MNKNKRKLLADILLIAALAAAGGVIALILLIGKHEGSAVEVRVSGETVKTFALDKDTTYEITGKDGGRNLLVIKDSNAWIEDADCPDRLCMNMGKISLAGQSVVCLPHEVVVEIIGDGKTPDPANDVDVFVN